MKTLEEHYDGVIAKILQKLPPYEPQALQKANAYGGIRYRQTLTQSSIKTLTSPIQKTPHLETQRPTILESESGLEDWPNLGDPTYPPGNVRSCLTFSGLQSGLPRTRLSRGPAAQFSSGGVCPCSPSELLQMELQQCKFSGWDTQHSSSWCPINIS